MSRIKFCRIEPITVRCSDIMAYVDGERILRLTEIEATDEIKNDTSLNEWWDYLEFRGEHNKKGHERTIEFTGECEILTEQEEGCPLTKKLFIKSIVKGSFSKREENLIGTH